MGHDAAVTKRKVIDAVKDGLARANDCIRDVHALQEKHNLFVRQVQKDLDVLTQRVSAASNWAEANEARLKNLKGHIDRQIQHVIDSHDRRILAVADVLPPRGFWARLMWLCVGPSRPWQTGDGIQAVVLEPPTFTTYDDIGRATPVNDRSL